LARSRPNGFDYDGYAPTMAARWLQQWQDDGFGYWDVTLPEQERVLGFGGVRQYVWRERDILNLYYRFTPGAWGHGYATEVARAAVTLARTYLLQWPVVARVRAINTPSVRVAERSGLRRAPELDDDHLIFALGWPETGADDQPV
jgi:RimJ/RimL family protein N-acetyltransferase